MCLQSSSLIYVMKNGQHKNVFAIAILGLCDERWTTQKSICYRHLWFIEPKMDNKNKVFAIAIFDLCDGRYKLLDYDEFKYIKQNKT